MKINKKNLYVVLFGVFVYINYFDFLGGRIDDFYASIERNATLENLLFLNQFQGWIFNLLSVLSNALIIGVVVGLFAYFFKSLNKKKSILIGFIMQYSLLAIVLVWAVFSSSSLSLNDLYGFKVEFLIFLLLQILFVALFSILGFKYGHNLDYTDSKDKELKYLYGISKKIWVLLIIAFNPILQFLSKFTILMVYRIGESLSSKEYWRDVLRNILNEHSPLVDLITSAFGIVFMWFIFFAIFWYGINVIKEKGSKYRLLKIILIFVVIPISFIAIPLIRNKTFFF